MGKALEKEFWHEIATFYNPNLKNMPGPYFRGYGMDMRKYFAITGIWIALALDDQNHPPLPPKIGPKYGEMSNLAPIFNLGLAMLFAGTLITGCKSNSEKEADATEDVQEAKEDLNNVKEDVKEDQMTKANDAEWQVYKSDANMTIVANEKRIEELTTAMNKPGKTFDAAYKSNIESLKNKNAALKTKIADYENNQTDWASFKREFDSDMTELGNSLKDLTVNNKK